FNSSVRSVSSSSLSSTSRLNSKLKKTASSSSLSKRTNGYPVPSRNIQTVAAQRNNKMPPPKPIATTVARPKAPVSSTVAPVKNNTANSTLNSTITSTGLPKKRPGWDLKGRLQDVEIHFQKELKNSSLVQLQLSECNNRIAQLESINQKLSGDVVEKQVASETAEKDINNLRNKLIQTEREFEATKSRLQRQIEDLEFQKSSLGRQKISLEGELEASLKEISGLKLTIALRDLAEKTETLVTREAAIEVFKQKERLHETERRKLHNTIQELKGNIRVFCRVRPLLETEKQNLVNFMNFPDAKTIELDKLDSMLNSTRNGKASNRYEFTFDRVFQPESLQAEVFEEISQLVQSALDGYNVCIFAYGQTGSGKTFTMEGSLNEESKLGMIPRTVQLIFKSCADLEIRGWQYTIHASMVEIYNESIRDLLAKGNEKLDIKLQGKGETDVFIPKLTIVDVRSEDKVLSLLRKASDNRAVAETKCNERSSRSHSVFQLRLVGNNSVTGESCKGMLNLVDLAGSERIKDSGSEGQRLVEAQAINKSLSHLSDVIMALGKKDKHIPYRNSKLTYLLQNSLGGNSKTLMFVNVSPKEECLAETLNSLRFATKV
ncbi:unnamed protein product, partial [Lymnaea stagnalis]